MQNTEIKYPNKGQRHGAKGKGQRMKKSYQLSVIGYQGSGKTKLKVIGYQGIGHGA